MKISTILKMQRRHQELEEAWKKSSYCQNVGLLRTIKINLNDTFPK